MYVSKELALILKENGFNYHKFDLIIAPTEQEVVDWIFDEIGLESNPNTHIDYERKRLKFWYTTLLEHKFSLMYEFIGRLEEWFESNNMYPISYLLTQGWQSDIHILISKELDEMEVINLPTYWDTKQQAKHEAIMKCFELLNSDKDDAQ